MLLPKQFTGDSHISILYWCSFWFFDCYTVQYITIQFNTITFSYILIFRSFYFLSLSVFLSVSLSIPLSVYLFFLPACVCLFLSLSLSVSPSFLPLTVQGLEKEKVIDQGSGPAGHAEWLEQTERWRRTERTGRVACHSASPHKDKPRPSTEGAERERAHSESDKSRERDWPALLRHDAIYRKSFWMQRRVNTPKPSLFNRVISFTNHDMFVQFIQLYLYIIYNLFFYFFA